ncbi:WD40 repeat domain-containing protein KNAG_0A03080 [Huiozyma naganishii CBS 8797]|uniref:Uncharacterized protein n=1 Tax=Huiozyma naganishii (strain ATCC MYA-139 / BCRC 22969 / CBS 8797 / KCTC 17520 / NBRC 10181 / NCYC 3082 / Yp74L-3) TaxID=1071383 RepID=J7S3I8_HUIN7|nr:hypothetical protein KNAG_0A03080 [Kazachstania naganishii CBS 8797]CCK67996.1 hypothetical protein KNAG_0A03080 [Kazachstania naganishii CBS 8797]
MHSKPTKIWRRSAPSLYHHISSVKPQFMTRVGDELDKTIAFRSEIIPDKAKETLTTSLLYSQGSDIYEIDCALPLGSFYGKKSSGDAAVATAAPVKHEAEGGGAFCDIEDKKLSPKWVYSGETVSKMCYLDDSEDSTIIAMSKNGSLAWFRDGIRVPIHIVQEMMGPMTSFAAMHSHVRPQALAISDFGLSENLETLVKSQSNGSEEDSILKIVDNAGKPGEVLRTMHVPGTTVTHTVRFFDNYTFGSCSDDNTIRFWDIRTADKPIFSLSEPKNGKLTAFDASQITNELFVTGTSTGVIKLWDIRSVEFATTDLTHRQNGHDPIQTELVNLYHSGGDSVADVQFSPTSSSEFATVGGSGNVYHWDMEFFFSQNDDDDAGATAKLPAPEELQGQCLKFFHIGNNQQKRNVKNSVAWHPTIDDLVCTVDDTSLISVYKPFPIRDYLS